MSKLNMRYERAYCVLDLSELSRCVRSLGLGFLNYLQMKTSHSGLKGLVIICKPV